MLGSNYFVHGTLVIRSGPACLNNFLRFKQVQKLWKSGNPANFVKRENALYRNLNLVSLRACNRS